MPRKICGIYGIFSEDGKKVYIGQSINIKQRWARHASELKQRKHHCPYLQRYFNGGYKVDFQILEECSPDIRGEKETFYWDTFKAKGLDMFNGKPVEGFLMGEHHPRYWLGKKRSEETREKLRKAKAGVPNSPEARLKISQANTGRIARAETKKAIGKANEKYIYTLRKGSTVYSFGSMAEFCSSNNLSRNRVDDIFNFNHPRKEYKGFYAVSRVNNKTGETDTYEV